MKAITAHHSTKSTQDIQPKPQLMETKEKSWGKFGLIASCILQLN